MDEIDIRHSISKDSTFSKEDVFLERTQEVHDHSELWATIAKPFAWFIFILVAFVIIVPFIIIAVDLIITKNDQLENIMRWSSMVLAPIIGFGSGVIGYYFGTNGSSKSKV